MKTFTITLIALLISVSVFSQQNFKANEVKLNLANTVFFLYPEISYERILNHDISVGASIGFGGEEFYSQNFNFTPHFRWFFGGSRETMRAAGTGFFIEANTSLYSFKNETYYPYTGESWHGRDRWESENKLSAGFGLSIGWKYLTRNCWVGELMLGGGRDFVNDGGYPRIGISIGRRF
jgi:hypothetical protein